MLEISVGFLLIAEDVSLVAVHVLYNNNNNNNNNNVHLYGI